MKSYDEMTKNVLKRRDEALLLSAKKKKTYIKTASAVFCFALVALFGFFAVKNQFPNDIIDTERITENDITVTSDTKKEDTTHRSDDSMSDTKDTEHTDDTTIDITTDTESPETDPPTSADTEPEPPSDTEPEYPTDPETPITVPDFSSYPRYEVVPYQFNNIVYPQSFSFFDREAESKYKKQYPYDRSFTNSLINFSVKTSEAIGNNGENLVYSPLSLYYALSILATGATGEAQSELLDLLDIQDTVYLALQCENLYTNLYTDNEISKLKIANSIWIDQNINPVIKSDWLNLTAKRFFTSVHSVDLNSPQTGELMSQWISDTTNGKLSYDFTPDLNKAMSIINSLYFYDEWKFRFNENMTTTDLFTCANKSTAECEFMNKETWHEFFKLDNCNISYIELKNSGAVYFLLPSEGVDPMALLYDPTVNETVFNDPFDSEYYGFGPVIWKIPKFSYENSIDLTDCLRTLGVNSIFDTLDPLLGISDLPLNVSDVSQKTHIGIDEKGIEGATYTEIEILPTSPPPNDTCEMILDRPFAYIVVIDNVPVFVGVVNEM